MPDQNSQEEKPGLQKLLDQVAGSGGDKASWPVAIFLISIFVLLLSILGVKLALTKRAAAETAKKLREELEREKQARENEKLADNAESRREALEIMEEAEVKIAELQNSMDARRAEHEDYVKELQSVTTWDQIVVVDARGPNG